MSRQLVHLSTCLLIILFASCSSTPTPSKTVAVTIEPLRWLTEQIAADRVDVVTMVPGGSSPETYEPTARQMVSLSTCRMYVKVGHLGFERTWTDRLQANAPQMEMVDASEGIEPLGSDPHVWTSPRNLKVMARNVYRALSDAFPADSAFFRARLDSLTLRLDSLDKRVETMLSDVKCRSFLIYHPALTYFARDYHLRQLALEEEGREPSAASMQALVDQARREGVRLLLVQKEFGGHSTTTLQQATGATPVTINPLSYDCEAELTKIATILCNQ